MKIIALAGPMGVGKSTTAYLLAAKTPGAVVMSFATPLRAMLSSLLISRGMSAGEVYDWVHLTERKNVPCPALNGKTVRHALQTLGTEWGRDLIDPYIWADTAVQRALSGPGELVIFDDARFDTELERVTAAGGTVYELHRAGIEYPAGHASEGQLAGKGILIDATDGPMAAVKAIMEDPR